MVRIGENQKEVLRRAIVEKEQSLVTYGMAKGVYGDKMGAKKCLKRLESKGVLDHVDGSNGAKYIITNLPEDLYLEWIG